jgi:hypothetical protein
MSKAKRDYKKEYEDYQGKPEQIKRRSARNKARRKLGLKKGDPREAAHIGAPRKGSLSGVSVRAESRTKNRKDQPKRSGRNQRSGH